MSRLTVAALAALLVLPAAVAAAAPAPAKGAMATAPMAKSDSHMASAKPCKPAAGDKMAKADGGCMASDKMKSDGMKTDSMKSGSMKSTAPMASQAPMKKGH